MAALLAGAAWGGLIGWLMLRLLTQFRTYRAISLGGPERTPGALPAVAEDFGRVLRQPLP